MDIIIGGDLVPTDSNALLFSNGEVVDLIGADLFKLLDNCDFSIFNLEVPFTDAIEPIKKCGPNLVAKTSAFNGIKGINPRFLNLANNHIMDQGAQGLFTTIDLLDQNGIAYAGAGKNIKEVRKFYINEKEGKKIGIYCCAEHEFSIATETMPGANPFDPFESLDHISKLKKECDYLITLYHGGKEHYRYPSPYLQKVCRKIIDKGADLVVCQHSHCIGCKEEWGNGTIVYGQGNFLFDHSKSEYWQTGLLIKITLDQTPKIDYIPIRKHSDRVRIAEKEDAEEILNRFEYRSQEILIDGFIEKKYKEFSRKMIYIYYNAFGGAITHSIFYRILNKISGHTFQRLLIKVLYRENNILALRNFIECEAHRELLLKGLENEIKK